MKYAALITTTYTIPGDERSRTYPGHGYPESTGESTELKQFKDKAEMQEWVKRQQGYHYTPPKFRLIQYEELSYEAEITIKIK